MIFIHYSSDFEFLLTYKLTYYEKELTLITTVASPHHADPCASQNSVPQIVGALTPLEVEEGSAARFSIIVHGFPQPAVSWFCDGRKLDPTPRMKVCCPIQVQFSH